MFFENRFTVRAEYVLRSAHDCAAEMGHGYVGSEHLLLGIARDVESRASRLLGSCGITAENIKKKICENMGRGDSLCNTVQGLTPCAKKIVRTAYAYASADGASFIGTEHLLLGIADEELCAARKLLILMKVDVEKLHSALMSAGESGAEYKRASESRQQKEKNEGKLLKSFGRDLTALAREGKLDPVIGREKEIGRMVGILSRRTKNNPVLLGDPGVGKTAAVEGLALLIAGGDVPKPLAGKRIFMLDMPSVIAGTKYRGEFEERIKSLLREVSRMQDIILFIDELHTIVGAGSAEGAIDAANILKPALSRREIQLIGATTFEEYKKHIERDSALERRFQPIEVPEPDEETCFTILSGLRAKYEEYHKVAISDDAIRKAIELSVRYINDRRLPDKAIDLIDETASRIKLRSSAPPSRLREVEDEIRNVRYEKDVSIREENFSRAQGLHEREICLRKELQSISESWHKLIDGKAGVTPENIAETVQERTGIPISKITEDEGARLLRLEESLEKRVIGQGEAICAIARAIRRARCGLSDPTRPTGSFLLAGPTGVGKTELCRALAECLFGDEKAMIRIDMSEYTERHEMSKLIGSPPGYIGHNDSATLVDRVRRSPYSVVLFDEVEKAHPDVFNLLLQILDDGKLTDSHGKSADFKNAVVIMTSNIGAEKFTSLSPGFGSSGDGVKKSVMAQVRKLFRPELINRIDEIVIFNKLRESELSLIADKLLTETVKRAERNGIALTVSQEAKSLLIKRGFDEKYGARHLRREIQNTLEAPLAELFLKNGRRAGSYPAYVEDGELKIRHTAD